jgi:pilus assembly protein CpaF
LRDGTRRIVGITEVQGMESDVITLQDAFSFDFAAGVDPDGRFRGHAAPTGLRPRFLERFSDLGITLPTSIFQQRASVVEPAGERR